MFHNQNIQTLSPLYREVNHVPKHVKTLFESQMKRSLQNFKQMSQEELQTLLQKVARTDPNPLPKQQIEKLSSEYALTPDNLLKMILIMLRVKSHIPVIVMGETGCGKTSLIRYLATVSEVAFDVLPIHAGIEEKVIIEKIMQNNDIALQNPKKEFWLLLDEINTSSFIGMMNDAMCSGSGMGKTLAPNLIVMGACNPYKLRSESTISTSGLQGKLKTDELSKLVYRVLPLPERLVDYVWDFGSLSEKDEAAYIRRMIDDIPFGKESVTELLSDLLSTSQSFVRQKEDVSHCVSLRDIQRSKTLLKWFLEILPRKSKDLDESCISMKAIILALAICYHSRFAATAIRQQFREKLQEVFEKHSLSQYDSASINRVILEEQNDILNRMELPTGTAKNTALRENVFVIVVCLLNKIPVFLVGKPGCSKSLSMQVIRSNLRGKDSKDEFFKTLPQLYCVSFQGSESSTSDGITKVFEKATNYQASNSEDDVLSVVILDEIGLAEISRHNPLKVLHSLLEPDGRLHPDVAVVGISNWSLDASKMNRGIHLSRPDMDEDELFETGMSISESFLESKHQGSAIGTNSQIKDSLKQTLHAIANSYLKYINLLRFKNFHGLRDYYSLTKFVAKSLIDNTGIYLRLSEKDKQRIILEGLLRNFGGLPAELRTLLQAFNVEISGNNVEATDISCLIKNNICDKMARHLMCITSGDSAMSLIENLLTTIDRQERVVIFGSQFEEDQTDDYNYRILSRIILCMEQGYILILRDLENVYGSLYDMLNQNYTIIGKKKHCRVALGHYSNPICQVHDDFRCIVLTDEHKLNYSDPPFLNRFEKQYIRFTDMIDESEKGMITKLQTWVENFSRTRNYAFTPKDCFPIYSEDLVTSLIKGIYEAEIENEIADFDDLLEKGETKLLCIVQPDAVFRIHDSPSQDIRMEVDQIKEKYLNLPIHFGIWRFVDHQLKQLEKSSDSRKSLLTAVLTNSSIHVRDLRREKMFNVQVEKLGSFKSEKQLSLRIKHFWEDSSAKHLFLHCSVADDEKHIALAKTTMENIRIDSLKENPILQKHTYMILHLDRRRMDTKTKLPLNFLSEWEIVTLDSLEDPFLPLVELYNKSLHDVVTSKRPLIKYISEQLFWSFTRIKYQNHGRGIKSVFDVLNKIKNSDNLLEILEEEVCQSIFVESDSSEVSDWLQEVACDAKSLNQNSSFVLALEQKIYSVVKIPLSKLVFQLENINAIATFFISEEDDNKKKVWDKLIHDPSLFKVVDVPVETGPECYLCTAADLSLTMPTSKLIYDGTEETKDQFMKSFHFLKAKLDLDEDENVPPQLLRKLMSQHESIVDEMLPDMKQFLYENISCDYFHDFSNLVSHALVSELEETKRIETVKQILKQKMDFNTESSPTAESFLELVMRLHATYWIFSSVLNAELKLIASCIELCNFEDAFPQCITNEMQATSYLFTETKSHTKPLGSMNGDDNQLKNQTQNIDELVDSSENEKHSQETSIKNDDEEMSERDISDRENSTRSSSSEESDELDFDGKLVHYTCLRLLPTRNCLDQFESLERWIACASIVLSLSFQISTYPEAFHALRFCHDSICSLSTENRKIKRTSIIELALLIQQNKTDILASKECFEQVEEMIFGSPKLSDAEGQIILAAYFNRCLDSSDDPSVMLNFLSLLSTRPLSSYDLSVFKRPLYRALLDEMKNDDDEVVVSAFIQADKSQFDESQFLSALDDTLGQCLQDSTRNSNFPLLMVDIIEMILNKDLLADKDTVLDTKAHFDTLLLAHKCILSNDKSLRYIMAIAYYKAFINALSDHLRKSDFDIRRFKLVIPILNAVMETSEKQPVEILLQQYFVKQTATGMLPWKFKEICERVEETIKVYRNLEFTNNFFTLCFEGSPLAIYNTKSNTAQIRSLLTADSSSLEKAMNDIPQEDMLLIYTFSLSAFYIPRSYRQQNDTTNQIAKCLARKASTSMKAEHQRLFVSLLGHKDFSATTVNYLELDIRTNEKKTFIDLLCMTVYALLLSSNCEKEADSLSFMGKLLVIPGHVKKSLIYKINQMDLKDRKHSLACNQIISCSCCHRFIFQDADKEENQEVSCPVCQKDISDLFDQVQTTTQDFGLKKPTTSPLTQSFIQFLTNVCLMGSVALDFATPADLEAILDISAVDIPHFIYSRVEKSFENLIQLLHVNHRDAYIFLQACVLDLKTILCENRDNCTTPETFGVWTENIENKIRPLALDRHDTILNFVKRHSQLTGLPQDSKDLSLNENDSVTSERQFNSSLFRVQYIPELENLKRDMDLMALNREHPHPFLDYVLQTLPRLELVGHIIPLVKWILTTVKQTGYHMKKNECTELTVKEFMLLNENKKAKVRLESRFSELQKALSKLCDKQILLQTHVDRLTENSKMKECLYIDQDSPIVTVIAELVSIQNEFLDVVLQISTRKNCKALKFLYETYGTAVIPCQSIAHVKSTSLIQYSWDINLYEYSQSMLKYGFGKHICYDYDAIEKSLAVDLIINKCYILFDSSLPTVSFIDEFYKAYSSMVQEMNTIIPQEHLPLDLIQNLKDKADKEPGLTAELITHVGVLITLAKKTKCGPNEQMVEYLDKWKHVLTDQFPIELLPAPEDCVKMCHLVSLYGLLEGMNADPIESLKGQFRTDLSSDMKNKINSVIRASRRTAENILNATRRFIYRCVYKGEVDCSRLLVYFLKDESFWPLVNTRNRGEPDSGREDMVVNQIPPDLKVEQIYHLVKLLEDGIKVFITLSTYSYFVPDSIKPLLSSCQENQQFLRHHRNKHFFTFKLTLI